METTDDTVHRLLAAKRELEARQPDLSRSLDEFRRRFEEYRRMRGRTTDPFERYFRHGARYVESP